jgi:antimicrobial peptide system SdpB family protein
MVVVVILATVIFGYQPRWTCVPHWYVAFSLHSDITLGDGGDAVAVITTMLLIPMLLGDRRVWHWSRPRVRLAATWRGSSCAAWLALRCQIAIIYFQAAFSKLLVSEWRQGRAMSTVFVDPNTGLPIGVRHVLMPILASGVLSALISWSSIAGELMIAIGTLTTRWRRMSVVLACVLHAGIAVCMGLFSFSMTMVATVLVLLVDSPHSVPTRRRGTCRSPSRPYADDLIDLPARSLTKA